MYNSWTAFPLHRHEGDLITNFLENPRYLILIYMRQNISVPGDGGSQLKAKLNKPTTVASYCIKKTDYYYDLWLNLEQLVPFLIDCFVDNMR